MIFACSNAQTRGRSSGQCLSCEKQLSLLSNFGKFEIKLKRKKCLNLPLRVVLLQDFPEMNTVIIIIIIHYNKYDA